MVLIPLLLVLHLYSLYRNETCDGSIIANILPADDMVTQGTRASMGIILALFALIILWLAREELICSYLLIFILKILTLFCPFRVDRTYKLYYGGAQKRPDGQYSRPISGVNGVMGHVGEGNRKDVRNAVEAAHKAAPGYVGNVCEWLWDPVQICHVICMEIYLVEKSGYFSFLIQIRILTRPLYIDPKPIFAYIFHSGLTFHAILKAY